MQSRVLECAAEIAGGTALLCQRLEVSETDLQRWLANEETCPLPTYLKAVDIILESDQGFSAIFSRDKPGGEPPAS
jgi:hypothetical protein